MDRATGLGDRRRLAKGRDRLDRTAAARPLPDAADLAGRAVKVNDPFGWQPIIALNHLNPPFDNPKLRRALLPALDQRAFVAAVIGEQAELGHVPGGYFADGQPMATHAGLDVLTRPRDIRLAKQLVSESGYHGETVVLLSPSDRPLYSQVSHVTRELFQAVGLAADFHAMDWDSVVTRRTSQSPTDKGLLRDNLDERERQSG